MLLRAVPCGTGSIFQIFSRDGERLLPYFCLCFSVQQMCGGTLILAYASTIFQENLGMSSTLSSILVACALAWRVLSYFIAFSHHRSLWTVKAFYG
ncbi:hypothetical protein F4775DRAFT_539003 [Biscogniauxia sp. FL1348]|nr:hypothetical protein F4775DRAFT_539003 [Biscogniauxia sp. FL1348]